MATKNKPGNYDCYDKAKGDEPIFTLRGKDPAASYLVMIWEASRQGKLDLMISIARLMMMDQRILAKVGTDEPEKLAEARACAAAMLMWRLESTGKEGEP